MDLKKSPQSIFVIPDGRPIGSQREPLRKLDASASEWKPLGELDNVERIERQEVERKSESRNLN
jgi:hypothetical protein